MKYRYSFLLFFIAFLLQTTVFNHFRIFGMSPNLILCMVVIFSFLYEGYHGIIYGLLFGLVLDICFAEIFGIASICLFSIALICSELKRFLYKESMVSVTIVSLTSTAVYGVMYWGIYRMLGSGYDFLYIAQKEAVLLGYHAVVTLIIYHFVSKNFKHRSDRYMYRGNLQEARSLYRS